MWYYHAELRNYLVLGCCNKTEKLVGYFVKYGDSGSDIDPIADLYKTQVRELAEYICVPKEIVEKKPAPDLMPGMTDEFALQMPYEKIDIILYGLENELDEDEIIKEASVTKKDLEYIKILMKLAHYMNIVPPCPKIND
jgi:NAD+ synthase